MECDHDLVSDGFGASCSKCKVYFDIDTILYWAERGMREKQPAQQSVQPTPPLALSCECGSLYGVHEKFCPKYKSAGG